MVEPESSNYINSSQNIKKEEFNDSTGVCPFCNKPILNEDLFCVHCGNKLPETNENSENTNTKVCPKCKSPIGEKDLFCCNCGEAM